MKLPPPIRFRTARRTGLSLVEVSVATLLVGLTTVASLRAIGNIVFTRTSANRFHDGAGLAQALMAEILQCRYIDESGTPVFGLESGEYPTPNLRTGFDDVDDYHGWTSSPPRPRDSTSGLSGYSGWTRTVQVVWADPLNPGSTSTSDKGLKRVTVTVTDPSGRKSIQVGFRSRYGALQQTPAADTTVRTYLGNDLRIGNGSTLHNATNLTNHAQDR